MVKIKNKTSLERPKSAPPVMTQNTHRTELILMFENIVFWYNFSYKA